jgi:hypothetical protein
MAYATTILEQDPRSLGVFVVAADTSFCVEKLEPQRNDICPIPILFCLRDRYGDGVQLMGVALKLVLRAVWLGRRVWDPVLLRRRCLGL